MVDIAGVWRAAILRKGGGGGWRQEATQGAELGGKRLKIWKKIGKEYTSGNIQFSNTNILRGVFFFLPFFLPPPPFF